MAQPDVIRLTATRTPSVQAAVMGQPRTIKATSNRSARPLTSIHPADPPDRWRYATDAAIWNPPSGTNRAVSKSVSVSAPSTGFQMSKTPAVTDRAAVIRLHRNAGMSFDENTATSPTTPLIRKSQPTKMSTAMVAATGAAKARMPSSTMIAPWNSRRRQWDCSASLIARCMMLGTGFRVAIVFSGNPPGFDRPFAAAGAHILRGGVAFRTLLPAPATGVPLRRGLMITASIHLERPVAVTSRPFRILGIQQIALGSTDKSRLRRLWVDLLGLRLEGSYRSERENVDEAIAV